MQPIRGLDLRRASFATLVLAALALGLWAVPAGAQIGDVTGPGQPVEMPPPQCPSTVACTYSERNYLPDGYRFQALRVCGANCSVQYWVSSIPDGQQLLVTDPVRGGGIIAVGPGESEDDPHPPVRTVLPNYTPADPACCPSGLADTIYTWDPANGTLGVGATSIIPTEGSGGWEAIQSRLKDEGFSGVFESF
jgi:hypothetical protein